MDFWDHFTGRGAFYNGSMVLVWAWLSLEVRRTWPALRPAMRAALGTWWTLGLVLVWARFYAGSPASGHAVWMWSMLAVAVRLDVAPAGRLACAAVIAMVFVFKAQSQNLVSVAWGSAIGLPAAIALTWIEPFAARRVPAREGGPDLEASPGGAG